MNYYKSINDIKESINILEGNIKLFYEGTTSVYRVIAVELWKLLCDKDPLVTRLFQNCKLHPLSGYISQEEDQDYRKKFGHSMKEGLIFQMPGTLNFDGKGSFKLSELFDEKSIPLELNEWLNQTLFNQEISIRQLIKSIRHKEGAHSDLKYDKTLMFTKSVKINNEDVHIKFIVAIGEYILKIIKIALR